MNEGFVPNWNKARAEETFKKFYGCVLQRPNGQQKYTLLGVEAIHCGWGIRVRSWPDGNSYVYAHNAIEEEMAVVKRRPQF